MATKTWKLGEVCRGGIITVETKGSKVAIIGKDWNHENGGRRSQQKNNKEWTRFEFDSQSDGKEREADEFLHDLTTSYHSGEILDWIKTKVEFKQSWW
jgi:hypothetical protein